MNRDIELAYFHLKHAEPPKTAGDFHNLLQITSRVSDWLNNAVWEGARVIIEKHHQESLRESMRGTQRQTADAMSENLQTPIYGHRPEVGSIASTAPDGTTHEERTHKEKMRHLDEQRRTRNPW